MKETADSVSAKGTPTPQVPSFSIESSNAATLGRYQQIAAALLQGVAAELAKAGVLIERREPGSADFIRGQQTVSIDYIRTAIAEVETRPELASANDFDPAVARDVVQFLDAFKVVVDQFEAWRRQIKYAMAARKAPIATGALQIYGIAKAVFSKTNSTNVANLRRDLRRAEGVRRAKAKRRTAEAALVLSAAAPTHPTR